MTRARISLRLDVRLMYPFLLRELTLAKAAVVSAVLANIFQVLTLRRRLRFPDI